MAMNRVRKFPTINQLQNFLNGAIVGGNIERGLQGLVGKTLIFTSPSAATVTFTGGTDPTGPGLLRLKDIKSQIEAALATVVVFQDTGAILIREVTPASGVAISAAGTANTLLGFDSGNPTAGKLYSPPGVVAPPQWTWIESTGENAHLVVVWE